MPCPFVSGAIEQGQGTACDQTVGFDSYIFFVVVLFFYFDRIDTFARLIFLVLVVLK